MLWQVLQNAGFYVFLILAIYFVIRKKYVDLLILHFWAITFAFCFKFYITIWTPEKIIDLAMIFCIIFRKPPYRSKSLGVIVKIVLSMFVLVLFGDIIGTVLPKLYFYAISPLRRMVLQNFAYLTATIILLYGPFLQEDFSSTLLPKYYRAVECAIIIGVIHFVCIKIGVDFIPIMRAGMENSQGDIVIAQFGDSIVQRVYGFSGEPKGLAFHITPYLIISYINYCSQNYNINKRYHLLFLLLGVFVVFETYSSSAFIMLILMLPVLMLISNKQNSKVTMAVFAILLSIAIIGPIFPSGESSSFVESLYERTFARGINELENDKQEAVIMEAFSQSPLFVHLWGWGVGQYTFNVPDQVSIDGHLVPVESGIVLTLCDFGIVGVFIWLFIVMFMINIARKARILCDPIPMAFALAAIGKVVESLMHGAIYTPFLFLMIAVYSYEDASKKSSVQRI